MLRARSGMNGVMAKGCFHVWGGEEQAGMFPDHMPSEHAYSRSRRLRVSLRRRPDLGLRWRDEYRRQPRQHAQPGLQADRQLRVIRLPVNRRVTG